METKKILEVLESMNPEAKFEARGNGAYIFTNLELDKLNLPVWLELEQRIGKNFLKRKYSYKSNFYEEWNILHVSRVMHYSLPKRFENCNGGLY